MKKLIIAALTITMTAGLLAGCATGNTGASSSSSPSSDTNASGTTAPAAATKIIKIAHAAKPGSARDLGALKIKEVVEAETKGQIEVQVYPSSQLGGGVDLIQGMQTGTIEMVILPTSFLGSFQPLTTIMDIPYLLPDTYEGLKQIEQGEAGKALRATTDSIGISTLDIWHTGYKTFTAKTKLETPADFKGLKFRVMPSPIQIAQYGALGATPINMDFSECYNSLQTGAIDGQENPLDTTTDMNFQEVQKFCTISRHGVLDQFIMAGKAWHDGLDAETQAILMKGVEAGRQVTLDAMHEAEKSSMDKLSAAGITVKELTPEERQIWSDALAPVRQKYVDEYGEEAQKLLDIFEAEIAKLA